MINVSDLKSLPFYQWLALIGIGMLLGATGVEVAGVTIPSNMHYFFGLGGILMLILAWWTNENNKDREAKRQALDAAIRQAKLDKGLDPADDVTVITTKD